MQRQLHFRVQGQRHGFQCSKTEEWVQVSLPTGAIQNKACGGALVQRCLRSIFADERAQVQGSRAGATCHAEGDAPCAVLGGMHDMHAVRNLQDDDIQPRN